MQESRVERIADDGSVVFLRRDGLEVRVDPQDVVGEVDLAAVGCAIDASQRGRVRDSKLINARTIPWPRPGVGCPSLSPTDVALVASEDAAFGEVRPLLTLRDSDGQRWQASLAAASGSEDPRLVGAVALAEVLVVVASDGDDLLIMRLDWDDGSVLDAVRW